ncbi:hypothetical protein AAOGI_23020 [Agarivorans albus]
MLTRPNTTLFVSILLYLPSHAFAGQFLVSLGGFYSQTDSGFEVQSTEHDKHFNLDFESDLDLKETVILPYLEIQYWFNDRHAVFFDWRSIHRSGTREKVRGPFDFDFGSGQRYLVKAGSTISTRLDLDISRIGYGYNFYQNNNWELGATFGLHLTRLKLEMQGELEVCVDNNCQSSLEFADGYKMNSVAAPLPDLGLSLKYQLSDNWKFKSFAQYFFLEINDVKGDLVDLNAGFVYNFNEQFWTYLSYKYYRVNVDLADSDTDWNIRYAVQGPALELTYAF